MCDSLRNFLEPHRFYPVSVGVCNNVTRFKRSTCQTTLLHTLQFKQERWDMNCAASLALPNATPIE
jgi:hypothetical protein